MFELNIKRGDTKNYTLNIKDCQGNLIDCTGWTIYFVVRLTIPPTSEKNDTNSIISKVIAGQSTGIHSLTITSSDSDIDPKRYLAEIQYKKPDNSIYSSDIGNLNIKPDIVRSGSS